MPQWYVRRTQGSNAGLITDFQWTPEQQQEIFRIARETVPGIKTHAIPTGLQVQVGPEGVVKYLMEQIDGIMAQ